ncbi:hypothetical protein pdam_00024899 [Pocillopora damicornis]|uniref:Uncharacterized protein n=1 Tax=Pocillopora damicornis TaxID=46731 RepID=A0A3M6UDK6_POCDA|nr:hypothetical protein pdam_00024899 [Pocillopora damicornis]
MFCCMVANGVSANSLSETSKKKVIALLAELYLDKSETVEVSVGARFPVSKDAHNIGHKPLWNEVKFIDRDPYHYTRRVKEAIHIRLNPDKINRESGIEIPEAWMPTIKKHNNRRAVRQRTAEGANHRMNEQGSKCTNQSC